MSLSCFFFFNDTATTEIYTLSLHDALPISLTVVEAADGTPLVPGTVHIAPGDFHLTIGSSGAARRTALNQAPPENFRSEEHTSELQSRQYLVCRLLLEKKKHKKHLHFTQSQ